MDVNILEDSKTKLVIEMPGLSHTLANSVKTALWDDKNVKVATYTVSHPLVGVPKLTIETSGEAPRKAISTAISSLSKQAKAVHDVANKL